MDINFVLIYWAENTLKKKKLGTKEDSQCGLNFSAS